jgi:hypothetical protein
VPCTLQKEWSLQGKRDPAASPAGIIQNKDLAAVLAGYNQIGSFAVEIGREKEAPVGNGHDGAPYGLSKHSAAAARRAPATGAPALRSGVCFPRANGA